TASCTVLNTGRPMCSLPPLPGTTPPMTLVPYSIICSAWKVPCVPVKPCTMTLVDLLTRTLIGIPFLEEVVPLPCCQGKESVAPSRAQRGRAGVGALLRGARPALRAGPHPDLPPQAGEGELSSPPPLAGERNPAPSSACGERKPAPSSACGERKPAPSPAQRGRAGVGAL